LGGLKLHGFVGLVYMAISAGFLLQTSHFGANSLRTYLPPGISIEFVAHGISCMWCKVTCFFLEK
jgi:hypothetical protein